VVNIRLTLEYDGSCFHGWQKQPGLRTIQGELHKYLELITRERIEVVQASGRTDAGVHARGQVINFHLSEEPDLIRLSQSVSHMLKGEVSVVNAEIVDNDFHSIRNAKLKQYSYYILNRSAPPALDRGKAWFVRAALNMERMENEAESLTGVHDFTSFRATNCNAKTTTREIHSSQIVREGDMVIYRVVGNGFLKNMVRNIVGTLVGFGRRSDRIDSMREILLAKDRRKAGTKAPAHGLFLDWVRY